MMLMQDLSPRRAGSHNYPDSGNFTVDEEQMADNPFEIPQQIRDVTEQNVRQARMAYGQFMDAMTQAMGMWFEAMPANAMTSGFKAVQDLATQYAKANAEAAFTLANNIAKARDMQEIISLQSSFGQSQMQAYATQAQEIGKMMAAAAQNAGRG